MPELRRALEEALAEAPDDRAAHMAYADLLTEEGDPRGELISVQLALEDESLPAGTRAELRRREADLLERHLRDWLGDLGPHLLDQAGVSAYQRRNGEAFRFRLARGWIDFLDVPCLDVALAQKLCAAPLARLIRSLVLRHSYDEPSERHRDPHWPPLEALESAPFLRVLRTVQLGPEPTDEYDVDRVDEEEGGNVYDGPCPFHADNGGEVPLLAKMTSVEEVNLFATFDDEELYSLPNLHHLRVLRLYHGHAYRLDLLAENSSVRRLTHLLTHPHAGEDSCLPLDVVRAFLHSPAARALRHLQLRLSDMGDKGVGEVIRSGVLAHLDVLDLRHGCVTDRGARALASSLPPPPFGVDRARRRW
jgi:uncharacterized protein (TIGR02996 family)